MPRYCLGLIDSVNDHQLSIGMLDTEEQKVESKKFDFDEKNINQTMEMCSSDKYTSDLQKLEEFLKQNITTPSEVQVLTEISSWEFQANSVLLNILLFMSRKGYCIVPFEVNKEKSVIRLSMVHPKMRPFLPPGNPPEFLVKGVSKAYADFLIDGVANEKQGAIAAAIIVRRKPLHYYLFSGGDAQSSQDILEYMRANGPEIESVISGDAVFTLKKGDYSNYEDLLEIPLEYAVKLQQYKHLGERDAKKIAILHVCRQWRIGLFCLSFLENIPKDSDIMSTELLASEERIVYSPEKPLEDWISRGINLFGSN